MGNWLNGFSKNTLAFCAIAAGMAFIILTAPPRTICDSQVDLIKDAQKQFLYIFPPKSKATKTTKYELLKERCRASNSPGGCYELFQLTRQLLDDLTTVNSECAAAAGSIDEVKKALWEMADLIVRLGWGEKPPVAYNVKFGWLDKADVTLFCKLKVRLGLAFGEPAFDTFREKLMLDLPGAKELNRQQVWEMSLFSENCARYP